MARTRQEPRQGQVQNLMAAVRKRRGMGASELARRAGVSRQTIYAIEGGSYVPNTEVALRLARELEVGVEELFALTGEPPRARAPIAAEVLSSTPVTEGQAVRMCQVGSRWVSTPVSASPYYLPEADGVVAGLGLSSAPGRMKRVGGGPKKKTAASQAAAEAEVLVFSSTDAFSKRLMLAGCDPATNLLARMVERESGVEIVPVAASSRLALGWLKEGKVHVAGSHLEDPVSGEFNLPYLKATFPSDDFAVVTFARWEEGLVTARGNPKKIRKIEHLARRGVKIANREQGSGSRGLLDRLLAEAGIEAESVAGYDRVAFGHLAAAYAVVAQDADCCLATRSAAQTFDLDFVPLHSERYDLVMRRKALEMPSMQAFLDVLQRGVLRRQLEMLAGYDTADTGTQVN